MNVKQRAIYFKWELSILSLVGFMIVVIPENLIYQIPYLVIVMSILILVFKSVDYKKQIIAAYRSDDLNVIRYGSVVAYRAYRNLEKLQPIEEFLNGALLKLGLAKLDITDFVHDDFGHVHYEYVFTEYNFITNIKNKYYYDEKCLRQYAS